MKTVAKLPGAAQVFKGSPLAAAMMAYNPVEKHEKPANTVSCQCGKHWLAKDFTYFNNYGWTVRKGYLCDDCYGQLEAVSDRVTRNRKEIGALHCSRIFWAATA